MASGGKRKGLLPNADPGLGWLAGFGGNKSSLAFTFESFLKYPRKVLLRTVIGPLPTISANYPCTVVHARFGSNPPIFPPLCLRFGASPFLTEGGEGGGRRPTPNIPAG